MYNLKEPSRKFRPASLEERLYSCSRRLPRRAGSVTSSRVLFCAVVPGAVVQEGVHSTIGASSLGEEALLARGGSPRFLEQKEAVARG